MTKMTQEDFDLLFNEARTYTSWTDQKIDEDVLKQVYDLAKMAPTAMNCQPMRVIFVQSAEAKEKLRPCLAEGNVKKSMEAGATAIIAADMAFFDHLEMLYPIAPNARDMFVGNKAFIEETAYLNAALQGAYLIMAARAMGLDCGPMTGFDKKKTDDAFFAGTFYKSFMLCNLGYGKRPFPYPRLPRFDFGDACKII